MRLHEEQRQQNISQESLRRSRYETDFAKLERMVAKTPTNVHLETVEEAQNKGTNSKGTGNTGVAGLPMGELPPGLLASGRKSCAVSFHYKRKTRTGRVL